MRVWAEQARGAVTAEWRQSAAAGPSSFGKLGSVGPRTAAVFAAEPANAVESVCTLEQEQQLLQAPHFFPKHSAIYM